ncbi:hypothetical protein Bhyg_08919, partial [Pseudolycoriella hygida]
MTATRKATHNTEMWLSLLIGLFLSDLRNIYATTLNFGNRNEISQSLKLSLGSCTVGNATYDHGETFKLDCKTQCVCEANFN